MKNYVLFNVKKQVPLKITYEHVLDRDLIQIRERLQNVDLRHAYFPLKSHSGRC